MLTEALKPSQIRSYNDVVTLCRQAQPHLDRLRIAGVPLEQEEERIAHLLRACEGILHHNGILTKGE